MKDVITLYKNYLYCLQWIKMYNNKYGDEDVLPIFEKKLNRFPEVKKMVLKKEKQ